MASIYKNLTSDDVVSTRTLLHEAIPITGSIISGTYNEANIKNYTHGRFQSVYDYPVLSSSANHIFDLTCGMSKQSNNYPFTINEADKKSQIYNQMAQLLVGHDITGSILEFDRDGNILGGGSKFQDVFFINFSRLLTKDEIKKDSFRMVIGTGSIADPFSTTKTIGDYGAQNEYRVNSPAGEYGILYTSSAPPPGTGCGLIFYQAGIVVLNTDIFTDDVLMVGSNFPSQMFQSSSIQQICNIFRSRIGNIQFNNTTELNSTIYFCRINHNEFNYSSNPTYLSESQIRVKQTSLDAPVSYITTVGLYSSANELLAVAKLSEPLKKDPTNEIILRTRIDW